jgi:hypothetical protein
VGFLVGGYLGYMIGAYLACTVFDAGNLCGLIGVFFTGPLGGIVAGGLLSRPRTVQEPGGPADQPENRHYPE